MERAVPERLFRGCVRCCALAGLLLISGAALAQGLVYDVKIDAPKPLAELLANNLDLLRWRGNPRLDREQLQRLVKAAPEQVRTLVATEGYYAPEVTVQLDTDGAVPIAHVGVVPGQPVRVGTLELLLDAGDPAHPRDAAALRNNWALPPGRIFRQSDWELAKRTLLRQVMQSRYPRAQLVESSATVDPDSHLAALRVRVDTGPEMHLGALRIEGLARYPASVVTNLNQIKPGDDYSEAALQTLQARLQDTGYFSGVDVSADLSGVLQDTVSALAPGQAAPAIDTTLPVLVRVTENKRKNVSVGLGYSTNTGNRAQLSYDDLAVFGLRMKSNITLETKQQSATDTLYFPTTAEGYSDSVGVSFLRNDINGEVNSVSTVAGKRAWGTPLLERSLTLEYLNERSTVAGQLSSSSQSLPLTYSVTKRALNDPIFPTRGYVVNAQLGGALLPILTEQAFVRGAAKAVAYYPLAASTTAILRAEVGALASKQKAGVPATYLFRAGGDQSVRGYGYQQLGVLDGTAVVGGRYLLTGSAEVDQWFDARWGGALFYDAGNAGDTLRKLAPKSGYGVGLRVRTPVGPINIDAAYGHAIKKYRMHFSLGFTF